MTTASVFWIAEYAAKAQSASPFVQSGRSAAADPVEFLHSVRRMLTLLAPSYAQHVLDIGCGNGLLSLVLSGLCRQVTAVERVAELADQARRNTTGCNNVEVVTVDAIDFDGGESRFDRILVWEAIQLMDSSSVRVLCELMARWLKPGGRAVLGAVPDRRHRDEFLTTYLQGVRRSTRLDSTEKAAIVARNERAQWYDVDELTGWWRALGGEARIVALPAAREKADHRVDIVLTAEGA